MNHELQEGNGRRVAILVGQDSYQEVTRDEAETPYDVARYTFQREGAAEGGPYVEVKMHATGGDATFYATNPERRGPDEAPAAIPAGSEQRSKLTCDVVGGLNDQDSAAMAKLLAGVMLNNELFEGDYRSNQLTMSESTAPETPPQPPRALWAASAVRDDAAHSSYTFQRATATGEDVPHVRVDVHGDEQAQSTYFSVLGDPGSGVGAEMQLEVQAVLDEQQSAAVTERLADLRFRIADEFPE